MITGCTILILVKGGLYALGCATKLMSIISLMGRAIVPLNITSQNLVKVQEFGRKQGSSMLVDMVYTLNHQHVSLSRRKIHQVFVRVSKRRKTVGRIVATERGYFLMVKEITEVAEEILLARVVSA